MFDIGFVPNSETPSQVPVSLLLETPMMGYTDGRMATHVWNELLASHPAFKNDFKTVKILIAWMASGRYVHTTKKVIRLPEDLKGVRILAWGPTANAVKLLGGVPVQLPPPDMYQSLDRGMVEGIVTAPFFINLFTIDPVLKTHSFGVNLGYSGFALLMSRDSWNKLSEDVKEFMSNELRSWATEESKFSMEKPFENRFKFPPKSFCCRHGWGYICISSRYIIMDLKEDTSWIKSLSIFMTITIAGYWTAGNSW